MDAAVEDAGPVQLLERRVGEPALRGYGSVHRTSRTVAVRDPTSSRRQSRRSSRHGCMNAKRRTEEPCLLVRLLGDLLPLIPRGSRGSGGSAHSKLAWPPIPPLSITIVRSLPRRCRPQPRGLPARLPRYEVHRLSPSAGGDPVASASSASEGFASAVPSSMTTSGSGLLGIAWASTADPSGEPQARRDAGTRRARAPAELVGPSRPGLADDVHRVRCDSLPFGPLEQEPGDRLVERLVRRLERADRRCGRSVRGRSHPRSPHPSPVTPFTPADEDARFACECRRRTLARRSPLSRSRAIARQARERRERRLLREPRAGPAPLRPARADPS